MSRSQTLAWAVLSFAAGILCYAISLAIFGQAAFIVAVCFIGVWLYKLIRDRRIINQAQLTSGREEKILPPPMTSPGSSRLFVPQPLDRN